MEIVIFIILSGNKSLLAFYYYLKADIPLGVKLTEFVKASVLYILKKIKK